MRLKATIVSLISIFIVALTAILLYCFWPAIKGTVDNSKYYTQAELQESYDKGYDDGCKTEIELTAQVKYYKSLVDEYYIQVNTLNDEITTLTKTKKDYETQLSNVESQKNNLQTQVDNLTTIKTNNETTIASLNNKITNLQKQVTNLTNSGEDKDELIANLNSQIATLQNTVAQLQATNDMNVATITSLNTQITNLNSQITNLTEQSQNSQGRINALNNKINELQASVTYYENYIKSLENGEQVVVTFEFDGSVYNIQIVNKGSKLSVVDPTSTTYKIFNGWTVNGEPIDLSTYTITASVQIIADVTYKYDVKFMVDDTVHNSQIIEKNSCATLPTTPSKEGYEFDGWSRNGVEVISDIPTRQVTENITYFAIFSIEPAVLSSTNFSNAFSSKKDSATSLTFDYYTNENQYLLDGLNVIYGKEGLSLDSKNEIKLFESGTSFFVLSDKKIVLDNLNSFFKNFINLKRISFKNFNTSKVTSMSHMFYGCKALTSLDLSCFDTSKVTNMSYMFYDCFSLKTLNITSFDTSNVMGMSDMFSFCCNLITLDLSSFNTKCVFNMSYMFYGCYKLETIYANDNFCFDYLQHEEKMFYDCTNLVGAISYDSLKTDVNYANYTTGYFTYKAKN